MTATAVTRARFSIGIDLGTTNTALAYCPLDREAVAEMLPIVQWDSPAATIEAPALPSFLYLPPEETAWVVGRLARARAAEAPGRVAHSAKSWLCHHSADRSAPFLPWGSDDIDPAYKISPVRAAALILAHLRDAWNARFAAHGPDCAFDAQLITITVPASFDAMAQRLTLAAAADAGYPASVRLLEEPQAAFYAWLERHAGVDGALAALPRGSDGIAHVLVVDVGGGTSDFSFFAVAGVADAAHAPIRRVAVSDHILLGGDNMDLALAHRLEPELGGSDQPLSGRQWSDLVARCRDVKELALSTPGSPDEVFGVAIAGRGAGLLAGMRSAALSRAAIADLIVDGFFPACYADEGPLRAKTALRELGLPYARDPGITRHLADFLRGRPAADAVLFNGGALNAAPIRERIAAEIGKWRSRSAPLVLDNAQPEFAVARGAAHFGKIVHSRARRIEAGAAHAVFVHAQRTGADVTDERATRALVCVLPRDAPSECVYEVSDVALALRINRPVRFQTYSSAREGTDRAGDIVAWNERDFQALPPLETLVRSTDVAPGAARDSVPVHLTAKLSELGRLEISCVSADPHIAAAWPLEFAVRGSEQHEPNGAARGPAAAPAPFDAGPGVAPAALQAAHARIAELFGRAFDKRDKLTASRLIKSLETILQTPKSEWNVVLVRSLWTTLARCVPDRARSVEHEEAWLIMAGFLLRPGFGAALDEMRIDELWAVREQGRAFAAKTIGVQEHVLWRRVAGGLARERQAAVLAPELVKIRAGATPAPESVLLAGSLERIDLATKTELADRFISAAAALEREGKHNAHYLAALASLLARAPLYAGPENVVPAELVQRAFAACQDFDWNGARRIELQTLFLRAARVVENRSIDLPRSLRHRIADTLEASGVPAAKTAALRNYVPQQRAERAGNFGESLPPGLILHDGPAAGANHDG